MSNPVRMFYDRRAEAHVVEFSLRGLRLRLGVFTPYYSATFVHFQYFAYPGKYYGPGSWQIRVWRFAIAFATPGTLSSL